METNEVVTNAVENPVVVPEVVENAVQAIEPVKVPEIVVPEAAEQKFLGLDGRTWTDVAVLGGAVAGGAILSRAIPWALRKVKDAVETTKQAFAAAKNGVNLNEGQQPAQTTAQTNEIPVPQTAETPVTQIQENK